MSRTTLDAVAQRSHGRVIRPVAVRRQSPVDLTRSETPSLFIPRASATRTAKTSLQRRYLRQNAGNGPLRRRRSGYAQSVTARHPHCGARRRLPNVSRLLSRPDGHRRALCKPRPRTANVQLLMPLTAGRRVHRRVRACPREDRAQIQGKWPDYHMSKPPRLIAIDILAPQMQ